MLIQGFNTFLPPGYRIECSAGNDPNTIRVTTPMGTTVQSISGGRALPDAVVAQGGGYYNPGRTGSQQQQSQHSIESPEAVFSPQAQSGAQIYNPAPPQHTYENAAAVTADQQQQRGLPQLTNAVATLGHPPRNAQTPTPGGQPGMNNGAQAGLEKRGPVEFNHAISYVNKIMVRTSYIHHCVNRENANFLHRIASKTDQRSTSSSSKFSKSTNESQNPLRRLRSSHHPFQYRPRPSRRFQAIPPRVCCSSQSSRGSQGSGRSSTNLNSKSRSTWRAKDATNRQLRCQQGTEGKGQSAELFRCNKVHSLA